LSVYFLPSTSTPSALSSSTAICRPFWTLRPYSAAPPLMPAEYPMTRVSPSDEPPPPSPPQAASAATRLPLATRTKDRRMRDDDAGVIRNLLVEMLTI